MRRVRIQGMLTVAILVTNVIGLIVGAMLLTVAFPKPSVILDAPHWVSFGIVPGYCVLAFILGTYWLTRQTARALRWAIEERTPSHDEARSAFLVPLRVALAVLFLWGAAAALWTIIYGLANRLFIPRFLFSMGVIGVVAATSCYLLTEFALRPMAAQALEVGATPRSLVRGIVGRTMLVWLLCSGVPNVGVALTAIFDDTFWELSNDQFMITVLILWAPLLIFGFILMWILAWLTATPVRVVREALNRVEQGDLSGDLVVFDGTELGELQRGFNRMVEGPARARTRTRSLRPPRRSRGRRSSRTRATKTGRRRAPCRRRLRRHRRFNSIGHQPACGRGRDATQPVLHGNRR